VLLADLVYDVPANVILDSARRALSGFDVITSCIKAWVFGLIISTVGAGTSGRNCCATTPDRLQTIPPPLSLARISS
jgi:ABC-type transporter Mla maintaining outer membrane lipid asymmetry permease subunit MlaE